MKNSSIIAMLSLALLGAVPLFGAEKETGVDAVLDDYIKAVGGKEAWNKVESRGIKADFEAMGSTVEWALEAKAPNKRVTRVDLPGIGLILDGFDGTIAWSKTQAGVRIKEGDELGLAKRVADFRRETRLKEIYPGLASKGTETLNGEEVRILESKVSATSKERFSFSAKTGLLVREQSEFASADGNQLVLEVLHSDYRDVDGIKYPYAQKFKILSGDQLVFEFTLKLKQITHNEKFEDAKFAKPAE